MPSRSHPGRARRKWTGFFLAPQTNVESSVDLFVIELADAWDSGATSHPTGANEVKILDRTMIAGHHTVSNENHRYYAEVAGRYGITLGDCEFESEWIDWAAREHLIAVEACTQRLLASIDRKSAWKPKRADKYKWQDIGRVLLRPSTIIKPRPSHLDLLVKSCTEISDRIASTRDQQTFHLAACIVWIEIRTNKNPQRIKKTASRVKESLELARTEPFAAPTPATVDGISYLAETFPKAFTEEISPVTVSAVVEIIHRSKSGDLTPDRVVRILRNQELSGAEVAVLAYVTVQSIGVEKIGHLVRSLDFQNWVAPDWSGEER